MTTRRRQKRKQGRKPREKRIHSLPKQGQDPGFKPVSLQPRTYNQGRVLQSMRTNDITFVTGPAGTGKTHLAIGMAVQMIRDGFLERLIVTRPLVSVGKEMGFLPGDITGKVGPFVQPCFDELSYYLSASLIGSWQQQKVVEIVPLSMMRGRTLNNAFVVLDEAQNAERAEIKTLMTRIGEPSRLVVVGDTKQSDLPYDERGAFQEAITRLDGMEGFQHVKLEAVDIVRHRLIREIINRLW